MFAKSQSHVSHSNNDSDTIKERQMDPHSHAVVLDPFFGKIAFVPDLVSQTAPSPILFLGNSY